MRRSIWPAGSCAKATAKVGNYQDLSLDPIICALKSIRIPWLLQCIMGRSSKETLRWVMDADARSQPLDSWSNVRARCPSTIESSLYMLLILRRVES
jgi:hypothetical protein